MSTSEEKEVFTFNEKSDYEKRLVELVKKVSKSEKIKQEYEDLLEEYLAFCEATRNGK